MFHALPATKKQKKKLIYAFKIQLITLRDDETYCS